MINVRSNVREFKRTLSRWEKRQVPFATSRALNATAFEVRKHFIEHTFPDAFTLRRKNFPRAVLRVRKSSKRNLTASVYDHLGREYLSLHEEGGVKRPRGQHLAVPVNVRRTARGIRADKRPRAVVDSGAGFIARQSGANMRIYERRKNGSVRLLYRLIPQARIRPALQLQEDGTRVVRRQFDRIFRRELEKAIRTAR